MTRFSKRNPVPIGALGYDPFQALSSGDGDWKDKDVYADAVKAFDPNAPDPLLRLFRSRDPVVISNAAFIFSELGSRGKCVIDEALCHLSHPNWQARYYIVDGMGIHVASVTDAQLSKLLISCNDESPLVRIRIAEMIARLQIADLDLAIAGIIDEPSAIYHRRGFDLFRQETDAKSLVAKSRSEHRIVSCYCYAALIALARSGQELEFDGPQFKDEALQLLRERIMLRKKFATRRKAN